MVDRMFHLGSGDVTNTTHSLFLQRVNEGLYSSHWEGATAHHGLWMDIETQRSYRA